MQNVIASSGETSLSINSEMATKADPRHRAWVEVKPLAVEQNARLIKSFLEADCSLMAVVKADGYGHGATTVARAALQGGASSLGIATLQEGIELRESGLEAPILVLGNLTNPEELSACLHWRLMPTINSHREVELCQYLAEASGRFFDVQLKFDTGMTRLGCDLQDVPRLLELIQSSSHLVLKGIYSHLALADGDVDGKASDFTAMQQERFDSILRQMPPQPDGFYRHLANSAGTFRDRSLHYDMVRVGLSLYGYRPTNNLSTDLALKPALAVKARVILLRDVPSGVGVSYGHRFYTKRPSRLAVVAIGYADGVNQALSGRISALINGKFMPQVGAITMDQLVLDATDNPELEVGSVVTMLGEDGKAVITPQQWSDLSGSIPWEVLCSFKHRLPRVLV